MIEAYPLHWPEGWPRFLKPKPSRFDATLAGARDGLLDEIRRLGGTQVILSTNIPLRQDGLPYARYRTPDDSGVAVYFQLRGQPQVFACDRWEKIEDNIQAIRKTIEAIRGIERWGSSEMMNRMFTGFQALPEKAGEIQEPDWWKVLGVEPYASFDEIEEAYRKKVKETHPDRGGSAEKFIRVQRAFQTAKERCGRV